MTDVNISAPAAERGDRLDSERVADDDLHAHVERSPSRRFTRPLSQGRCVPTLLRPPVERSKPRTRAMIDLEDRRFPSDHRSR